MNSFTFRGACGLLPLLLMAQELSLTAAAAGQSIRKLYVKTLPCIMQQEAQALGEHLQQKESKLHTAQACLYAICLHV